MTGSLLLFHPRLVGLLGLIGTKADLPLEEPEICVRVWGRRWLWFLATNCIISIVCGLR